MMEGFYHYQHIFSLYLHPTISTSILNTNFTNETNSIIFHHLIQSTDI